MCPVYRVSRLHYIFTSCVYAISACHTFYSFQKYKKKETLENYKTCGKQPTKNLCVRMKYYYCLFVVLCIMVIGMTEGADKCHWAGTAPVCTGKCDKGFKTCKTDKSVWL
uniref:Uncharacterized protein n=1 Tax=Strigamia maritima TaxID=126957 RepID=T1JG72_STRMM